MENSLNLVTFHLEFSIYSTPIKSNINKEIEYNGILELSTY